jgi:hypothetical protein
VLLPVKTKRGIELWWRNVGPQRRASHFASFPETAHMGADAEFDITSAQGCYFTLTESGLNGDEQQSLVSPSDPCAGIGS